MKPLKKFKNISELLAKKKSKQAISLYTSMVFGLVLGIGISLINTRALGKELYGDFKFIQSMFSFVITFSTLGLYYTSSRLIAVEKFKPIKDKIIGSVLVTSLIISAVLSIGIFAFSYFQNQLFDNNLGIYIRLLSLLTFVFPLQLFVENVLQGDNRIYSLSVFRMGPKVAYLISALILTLTFGLSLKTALFLHFGTILLLEIWVLTTIPISFKDFFTTIKTVWKENLSYGLHVYYGAITGVASSYLGALSIGYFMENTLVGFYSLAITATTPLSLIPNAIGTTFFKEFANMKQIPVKVILITAFISMFTLFAFLLVIKPLIILLYTEEFIQVVPFAYIMAFGAIVHGIGDFFNRFLGAHGIGKAIRNSNFILGAINVIGYSLLVYLTGAFGAAYTRVIAGIAYLLIMIIYYRKYIGKQG